jgi:hypothetical protein
MTDRYQIRCIPSPLHIAIRLAMPDVAHKVRVLVEGEQKVTFPAEIGIEGLKCIDREKDAWLIEGKITYCADSTKFKENEKVRAVFSNDWGTLRKIQVLSPQEVDHIVAMLVKHSGWPTELADITYVVTDNVSQRIRKWIERNPESAKDWLMVLNATH